MFARAGLLVLQVGSWPVVLAGGARSSASAERATPCVGQGRRRSRSPRCTCLPAPKKNYTCTLQKI